MDSKPQNKQLTITIPTLKFSSLSANHILVLALIIASFLLGSLITKVKYLEFNGAGSKTAASPSVVKAAVAQQPQAPALPSKVQIDAGNLPIKGNVNAKVTIVEFADFRCPFCEKFFTDIEPQLLKEYVDTGKAKLAFRNFAFLGQASVVAANAGECANEQDKFWDMHDYLYKNQPSESDTSMYTTDKLTAIAGQLGMDTAKFRSCLDSNKYDKNVSDDLAAGQKAGVNGTPTAFVNGTPVVGAVPYNQLKTAIDAELQK